ncbi:MGH1-like glycoside hydrolase domain-containing protein [Rhizosaccharibacter radicis]|uniref:Glucosidase n=1 Tax=Rhizosaccharibacter radicis TaxID=2782605 RepID=A0ABT1VTJ2_9PROT|nr:glucosidase [Acetobacteraceae bacterium KSS12]
MTDTIAALSPCPGTLDTAEGQRLRDARKDGAWKRWGPYLSDRQWGTVREDYSPNGEAWTYFPHDQARSRAYRWGEDAIAGFGDNKLLWCLGLALWNKQDPILKERLFGLTNAEGNHGEDVKELYYHLDSTPTHSLCRMLYKYPQAAYPYERLVAENARRGAGEPEFELIDTGLLDEKRYFDVFVDYAKAGPDDLLMRVRVINRGPDAAPLFLLPQLWARNRWSWFKDAERAELRALDDRTVAAHHPHPSMGPMRLHVEDGATLLFCDNDTNNARVFGDARTGAPFPKDGINDHVVGGAPTVNPDQVGTRCAVLHRLEIPAGGEHVVRLRFRPDTSTTDPFADFDAVFDRRIAEADEFYGALQRPVEDPAMRAVQRQAFAGLLWSKQFYEYDVRRWLRGDENEPPPPPGRGKIRNGDWDNLRADDIISMPDKWEYPWFASWDLAFQAVALAPVDPDFAKDQLLLLTREWYMHPSAALPAYEWSFGDANPPVHAWAAWRVFEIDRALNQQPDHGFLKRIFNKLSMNFTWWVNRKDQNGRNIFQGGFLGLDNIAIFDRSSAIPGGGTLSQSDGTAWMASYALSMLHISIELALQDDTYEDVATKFFEHFLIIAAAEGNALWDDQDGFFYDTLSMPNGDRIPLRARTMVGLIPFYAVSVLPAEALARLPRFTERMRWFLRNRPDLAELVSHWDQPGRDDTVLLSLLRTHRMTRLLSRMLDETEFLSLHGVRAVSRAHEKEPYRLTLEGQTFELPYWPGESRSRLFGGNSNWRGPIWMPVNYLLIESLLRLDRYYGDGYRVACPTGSDNMATLREVAAELSRRLVSLFTPSRPDGGRPVHGDHPLLQTDPAFRDLVLFYEYYDGDSGRGVGASHQCGWSALVAILIHKLCWTGPGMMQTGEP